jgi:hypothetical protein
MICSISLTVPPNTPENKPVNIVLRPTARQLKELSVGFPPGSLGSVFARVSDYGSQILPLSGWINSDTSIQYNRRLTDQPRLVLEAYSVAEDWPHTIGLSAILEMR